MPCLNLTDSFKMFALQCALFVKGEQNVKLSRIFSKICSASESHLWSLVVGVGSSPLGIDCVDC